MKHFICVEHRGVGECVCNSVYNGGMLNKPFYHISPVAVWLTGMFALLSNKFPCSYITPSQRNSQVFIHMSTAKLYSSHWLDTVHKSCILMLYSTVCACVCVCVRVYVCVWKSILKIRWSGRHHCGDAWVWYVSKITSHPLVPVCWCYQWKTTQRRFEHPCMLWR